MNLETAKQILKKHWGYDTFRPAQAQAIEHVLNGQDVLCVLPTSLGKCFGVGTPILMYDGSIKLVEDIRVGERVMGPDSQPRQVLSLARGQEYLYRVTPKKGDSYVVNESHVLSLKTTPQGGPYKSEQGGRIINVSVLEWLSRAKWFRHIHKGWRTGVDFPDPKPLHPDLPPYLLGIWLSDGTASKQDICINDCEVIRYLQDFARAKKWRLNNNGDDNYRIARRLGEYRSPLMTALREVGVINNKHIPASYLFASRKDRMQLLAGLTDGDGTNNGGCFDYVFKSKAIADGLVYLARSLGFAAYMKPCVKTCQTGASGNYWRITVSGPTHTVPLLVKRKKPQVRRKNRTVLVTGIDVEKIGVGNYYGFSVDGDHLFLLGDFTVVHKSAIFPVPAMMADGCALVISPLIALMKDQITDCNSRGIPATYVNSHVSEGEQEVRFKKWVAGEYKLFYVSPERLGNKAFQKAVVKSRVSYLVCDEVHMVSLAGHSYRPAYRKIHEVVPLLSYTNKAGEFVRPPILGFTATATPLVADDIAKSAGMDSGYKRVIADPIRPNIKYEVDHKSGGSWHALKSFFLQRKDADGRFVVYVATQKGAEMSTEILRHFMPPSRVAFYHGGMVRADRERVQDAFKSGTCKVVCATNAFGMGIDVPDIRAVMHLGISGSIEAYTQEAGRAGRDGNHSQAILVPDAFSEQLQKRFIEWENPPYNVYAAVWKFLNKKCSPGELLKMSTVSMAMEMSPKEKPDGINGESVAAVLRTMHAYGMVERSPVPYGSMATVDTQAMMNATTTAAVLPPKVMAVAQALWESQKKKTGFQKPYPDSFEVGVDKESLAEAAGVSHDTIGRALGTMSEKGILTTQPANYGKTTEILKYGEDLGDLLPEKDVKHRRDVAVARLDAMVGYTKLKQGQHVDYIRKYFTGTEG